ncbi:hypothetical protein IG631_06147 [Alternaria alternata]|nr:hypothetical protein IG631_06147 [Alternaria alternata]
MAIHHGDCCVVNNVLNTQGHTSYLLVQEHFTVISSFPSSQPKTLYTAPIRLWTLKETTVAPNRVPNAILRRTMKF